MIAPIKDFAPRRRRRVIRLSRPTGMTLITGAERERVDAVMDRFRRIQHLIVETRQRELQ